jgi:ketosteroid isomerase-like protein
MKWLSAILVAVLFLVPSPVRAQGDKEKKVAEIKKVDRELTESLIKGDAAALEKLLAKGYLVVDPVGSVWGRKKTLESIKDKTITFSSITDSDVKVRLHGDAAVITGISHIKGKTKTHDIDGDYRWTRVWVQEGGNWVCVLEQLTHVYKDKEKK